MNKQLTAFLLNCSFLAHNRICKDWFYQTSTYDFDELLPKLKSNHVQILQDHLQNLEQHQEQLDKCLQSNLRLIVFGEPEYPLLLSEIFDAPIAFWAKGNVALLHSAQVAIIGSRNATNTGLKAATSLAEQLCQFGYTISSGLALGIDSAGHRGALNVGGNTIAVKGSGFANPYPNRNINLMSEIIDNNGLVISEYFLTVKPLPHNFLERNRIISGLSLATVVVEASNRSGSLTTAKLAVNQGRELFAVPNNFLNKNSEGTNQLIKDGAHLATSGEEIDFVLKPQVTQRYGSMQSNLKQVKQEKYSALNLTEAEQAVVDKLSYEPIFLDDFLEKIDRPYEQIIELLTELELKSIIKKNDQGYFLL